jgi:lipopolysaccharide transport system ATP-binding protein
MSKIAIKVENLSKAYQLGNFSTGTISRDIERWWALARGKEDPFLKIGETNDRSIKGTSDIVWSLKDINFEIEQGDAVGIIGKNGAGKSTLLKILSRITAPTTGKISGNGRIASLLEVGTGFHPELTGRENIYLNGAILGMRKREIDRKFDEIVDFSGVERYIETPVKRYSSGMYVRLAFAVAAHLDSEILIVDEVLAVGDAEFQRKCLGKMGQVSRGEGRTVLFVSHNLGAVENLCNSAILLDEGNISTSGNIKDVIRSYQKNNEPKNEISFGEESVVKKIKLFQVEDKITIECYFHNSVVLDNPTIGIVVHDYNENKIFGSNTKLHPPENPVFPSAEGKFTALITSPLLVDGIYILSLWFGNNDVDFFVADKLLTFKVEGMVKYIYNHQENCGPVYPNVYWKQDNIY